MADTFVEPFIETDPDALLAIGHDKIRERFPLWQPSQPGFAEATMAANAVIISELRDLAAVMPRAAFRTLGAKLFRVPPVEASFAEGSVLITAKDNAGYKLETGQQFTVAATGDRSEGFELVADAVIPAGSTTVTAPVVALVQGSQSSALSGSVLTVQSFDWLSSVALVGVTTGGVDAETDDDYLDRLSRTLETMIRRPVLPVDVPVFARLVPGVERVYVKDNYNADTTATDQEKTISVFPIDALGANVPADVKTALHDLLLATRESNMVWFVRDPTRTNIRVKYWIQVEAGSDVATVVAAVDAAVTAYFTPARWGGDPALESPTWDPAATVVRRAKIIQVIENVPGVAYLSRVGGGPTGATGVELALAASALGTDDITLPGPAPLPNLTLLEHTVIA